MFFLLASLSCFFFLSSHHARFLSLSPRSLSIKLADRLRLHVLRGFRVGRRRGRRPAPAARTAGPSSSHAITPARRGVAGVIRPAPAHPGGGKGGDGEGVGRGAQGDGAKGEGLAQEEGGGQAEGEEGRAWGEREKKRGQARRGKGEWGVGCGVGCGVARACRAGTQGTARRVRGRRPATTLPPRRGRQREAGLPRRGCVPHPFRPRPLLFLSPLLSLASPYTGFTRGSRAHTRQRAQVVSVQTAKVRPWRSLTGGRGRGGGGVGEVRGGSRETRGIPSRSPPLSVAASPLRVLRPFTHPGPAACQTGWTPACRAGRSRGRLR